MPKRINADQIIRTIAHAQIRLHRQRPDRTYNGRHPLPHPDLLAWTCCHYELGYSIAVAHKARWAPGRDPISFMVVLPRATVLRVSFGWTRDGIPLCTLPDTATDAIQDGDIEHPRLIGHSFYPVPSTTPKDPGSAPT